MSSRRVPLDQGTEEAVPQGGPPTIQDSGANGNKGPGLSGSEPTAILETGEKIPSKDDHAFGAVSGNLETPDILWDMLQKASVSGE